MLNLQEKKILNQKELAGYLGIGLSKAYELIRSPKFYPAFRLGRRNLVNRDKLDEWLNEQCTKGR